MNMYTFYMQYMYSVTGEEVERIERGQLRESDGIKDIFSAKGSDNDFVDLDFVGKNARSSHTMEEEGGKEKMMMKEEEEKKGEGEWEEKDEEQFEQFGKKEKKNEDDFGEFDLDWNFDFVIGMIEGVDLGEKVGVDAFESWC